LSEFFDIRVHSESLAGVVERYREYAFSLDCFYTYLFRIIEFHLFYDFINRFSRVKLPCGVS
jgi:hypothetical protein